MAMYEPRQDETENDNRTVQSFKDQTDINTIVGRAARAGTLSHLEQWGGTYGDFSDFDFFEAQTKLAQAREIFDQLPSEVRREFANDPSQFFAYANDPANADRLGELLPALLRPGQQLPNITGPRPTPPATPTPPESPPGQGGETTQQSQTET